MKKPKKVKLAKRTAVVPALLREALTCIELLEQRVATLEALQAGTTTAIEQPATPATGRAASMGEPEAQ